MYQGRCHYASEGLGVEQANPLAFGGLQGPEVDRAEAEVVAGKKSQVLGHGFTVLLGGNRKQRIDAASYRHPHSMHTMHANFVAKPSASTGTIVPAFSKKFDSLYEPISVPANPLAEYVPSIETDR
jgi:hypothetical protein